VAPEARKYSTRSARRVTFSVLVIDTSALIARFTERPSPEALVRRLDGDPDWHAPHLVDVEALHVLRTLVARGALTPDRARQAREEIALATIIRYPHTLLLDRMWTLRANVTAYDAAFLTLAEALGVPLVTLDAHLGAVPGHRAAVEVFSP
jgi:predicted nucleic acid-binding protein